MNDRDPGDRRELVQALLRAAGEDGVLVDLVGPRGSGRSSVLSAVGDRLADTGGALVVRLNGAIYARSSGNGDLSAQIDEFLGDVIEAAGGSEAPTAPPATADGEAPTRRVLSVATVLEELRALAAGRRPVLLVDNVTLVPNELAGEVHRFLARLIARSRAAVVVARTTGAPEPPDWIGPTRRLPVPPLTPAEVREHLHGRTGTSPDPELCAALTRWSGGHPGAVAAATDRLARRPGAAADVLSEVIAVRSTTDTLAECEGRLRRVVEVGCVMREFTASGMTDVLAILSAQPPDDIAGLLLELPFLRVDPESGACSFLPFFREQVHRELEGLRSADGNFDRFDEINRAVLHHYREQLRTTLEDPKKAYASWEQLERSETQRLLLAFVHHGGLVREAKRARFALASVYFDFLWWWAWFVEAPFLTELLRAWQSGGRGREDAEFVGRLEAFRRAYVPLHRDTGEPEPQRLARWTEAVIALVEIRKALDLGEQGAANRHVLAITMALLGDSRRMVDLNDPQVDRDYETALRAFQANASEAAAPGRPDRTVENDGWCIPWVHYRQADLARERGQAARARQLAVAALDSAAEPGIDDDDRDFEVVGNLHRVLAQVALDRDPVTGFREHLRAVFAAYAFHAGPYPDEYTRTFHREHVAAAMAGLKALAGRDRARAVEVCEEIAGWRLGAGEGEPAGLLERRCWDELEGVLFPREPRPEEFEVESDYLRRVRIVRASLGARLLPAEPVRRRMGGLFGRRNRDAAPRAAAGPPIPALRDAAVDGSRFAAAEDERWPRWWVDEPAQTTWAPERLAAVPAAELQERLREAVAALPPLRRRVLELRDVEGWTRTAVSRELDISEDDQLIMLHRARAAVHRALDRYLALERPS